jgi:hypothetical protein
MLNLGVLFPFLKYNISTQTYNNVQKVQWDRWLNGFTLHNTGNTILSFNNDPIQPGGSKTVGGNFGEIYGGRIDIQFITPSPAPSTINNAVVITQKFYLIDTGK